MKDSNLEMNNLSSAIKDILKTSPSGLVQYSSSVLIIADLHLGRYGSYNPTPNFRFEQFIKLAHFIRDRALERGLKEVWILGDLLVSPKSDPEVMHYLKQFMTILTDAGLIIRFIYGNHDLLIKNEETGIRRYDASTLLSLLHNGHNIFGYKSEVVEIYGKKVHFQSWMPKNKIIHEEANYLMCHGDVKESLSPFVTNLIPLDGYDRVISGHIHVPLDTHNFTSPGSPIPHNFGDNPFTSLVIFDVVNNTIERIPTHGEFLKFQYAKDRIERRALIEKYTQEGVHVHVKVKRVKDKSDEFTQEDIKDISMSQLDIDPLKVLTTFTDKLSDEAKELVHHVVSMTSEDEEELSTPDLNVEFLNLTAKNFLSIKDINFDFSTYSGLTCITGKNGSGKSTLFNLILFMLKGALKGYNKADYTKYNKGKMSGTLTLKYAGNIYKIERTLSSVKFYENNNPLDSFAKTDLQKTIESKLKFIKFLNLMYIKQSSAGIFASMNDSSRVSLLSRLIGLSLITKWTKSLGSIIDDKEKSVTSKNARLIEIKGSIDSNSEVINSLSHYSELMDSSNINTEITSLQSKISELNSSSSMFRNKITDNNHKINQIDNILTKIAKNRMSMVNKRNDQEKLKSTLPELEENVSKSLANIPNLSDQSTLIGMINDQLTELNSERSVVSLNRSKDNDKLNHLINHSDVCPTCHQKVPKMAIEDKESQIESLKSSISESDQKIVKIDEEISKLRSKLTDIQVNISNVEKSRIIHDQNVNILNATKTQIESISDEIMKLQDELIELMKEDTDKSKLENSSKSCQVMIDENESLIKSAELEIGELNKKLGGITSHNENYHNRMKLIELNKKLADESSSIELEVASINKLIKELDKFNSKILSDKGLLVAALLEKVSEYLNQDDLLKVETTDKLTSGTVKPCLNIKLYVQEFDQYIDYDFLSGGQKLQADLRFLQGITNTLGTISFMMFDELFKFFDEEAIHECADIMKSMNVKNMFLILHGDHHSALTNSIINVSLDPELGSIYSQL